MNDETSEFEVSNRDWGGSEGVRAYERTRYGDIRSESLDDTWIGGQAMDLGRTGYREIPTPPDPQIQIVDSPIRADSGGSAPTAQRGYASETISTGQASNTSGTSGGTARMSNGAGEAGEQRSYSGLFLGLLALAIVVALAGLGWSYYLSGRLTHAEMQLSQAQQQNNKLASALDETNARLKVTSDTLGHSLGITQKQLESRAQDLLNRQQAAAKHFESEQQQTQQQISSVSSDVSGVKTDVGGVKTDLGATQTQLKTDEAQLQSMKGDLGVDSGLIATNAQELEILKHKGDRNYYEFTLQKGQKRPISTVSLELKKADTKHSRYTLVVYADDKQIEKKDRGLNEPVQFYTGKDNYLYELVVNSIDKNQVKGYIATPKSAPVPVSTSGE